MTATRSNPVRQSAAYSPTERGVSMPTLRTYAEPQRSAHVPLAIARTTAQRDEMPPVLLRVPDVSFTELPWGHKVRRFLSEHKLDVALAVGAIIAAALLFLPSRARPTDSPARSTPAWGNPNGMLNGEAHSSPGADSNAAPWAGNNGSAVQIRPLEPENAGFPGAHADQSSPRIAPDAEAAQKALLPTWKQDLNTPGAPSAAPPGTVPPEQSLDPASKPQQQPMRTRTVQKEGPADKVNRVSAAPTILSVRGGSSVATFEGIVIPTAFKYDSSRSRLY